MAFREISATHHVLPLEIGLKLRQNAFVFLRLLDGRPLQLGHFHLKQMLLLPQSRLLSLDCRFGEIQAPFAVKIPLSQQSHFTQHLLSLLVCIFVQFPPSPFKSLRHFMLAFVKIFQPLLIASFEVTFHFTKRCLKPRLLFQSHLAHFNLADSVDSFLNFDSHSFFCFSLPLQSSFLERYDRGCLLRGHQILKLLIYSPKLGFHSLNRISLGGRACKPDLGGIVDSNEVDNGLKKASYRGGAARILNEAMETRLMHNPKKFKNLLKSLGLVFCERAWHADSSFGNKDRQ
mmetsp:Transcript_46351/g.122837  ORF Transcript_46351/g.122837 Transcript_46351/m.122837 type:complete len:289 (-) Transcript_46351:283-1149(-)